MPLIPERIALHNSRLGRRPEVIIASVFLLWSAAFIFRSSFVAVDGNRYFCLFDDAMISMRYAWNLSQGNGLVWNAGDYVEGFTNLLMTLYMAASITFFGKFYAVLFIQASGIVFVLVIACLTRKIGLKVFPISAEAPYAHVASCLYFASGLCYYPLLYWSLMGMEVGLLTVLLLTGTCLILKLEDVPDTSPILPIVLGMAYLTRPDAIIFGLLIMAYRFRGFVCRRGNIMPVMVEIGILAMFVVAATAFRWLYYGEIVPNTYFLKVEGTPFDLRIKNGVEFVSPFVTSMIVPMAICLIGILRDYRQAKLLIISLFLASIGYQIFVGGDPFEYWRTMAPFVPLLFVLCAEELRVILEWFFNRSIIGRHAMRIGLVTGPGSRFRKIALIFLFPAIVIPTNLDFWPETLLIDPPDTQGANMNNVNTAIAISQTCNPQASVAVFWAGAIPYYTGLRAVDMLGKSDKYIARLPPDLSGAVSSLGMNGVPGHCKYDLDYSIKTLKPTYVQGFAWGRQDVTEYGQEHYMEYEYQGVTLWLLKSAEGVLWPKTTYPTQCGFNRVALHLTKR